MKKFVQLNENFFKLQEVEPKPNAGGQLQRANIQLQNFISMLETYPDDEGMGILARDMRKMAEEIEQGKPITTY